MLKRVMLFGLVGAMSLAMVACGPAPEAPAAEEAEAAPPPPPPPPVFELTEVAITEEMPDFTSANVSVLGVKIGDTTRNVEEGLGELTNTRTSEQDYITAYRLGGIIIYTFKLTGKARRIEITDQLADDIEAPGLRAWLEDGDLDQMRELMGEEESMETDPDANATEYLYDARGIRFVTYDIGGVQVNAIRFSE